MSICNTVYIHLAGCKVRVWSCLGSSPIHSLDKHQEDPVFGFFWEFLRALDRWLDNTKYCARPETWRSTLTKSFFFLLFLLSVILFPVVLAASFLLLPFLCYFGILSLFHSVSFSCLFFLFHYRCHDFTSLQFRSFSTEIWSMTKQIITSSAWCSSSKHLLMEANRFLPVEPRSIAFCVLPRGEIGYEVHTIAAWHELYRERER